MQSCVIVLSGQLVCTYTAGEDSAAGELMFTQGAGTDGRTPAPLGA